MKFAFPNGFSLNDLERSLQRFLPESGGYFVEVGGNDGFTQSNTKALELYFDWGGVLVEPHPENFRRMRLTRSSRSACFWAACVPSSFDRDSVTLENLDLMSFSSELVTLDLDQESHKSVGKNWSRIRTGSETYQAPARTLSSILEECHAPTRIDFLSLDVEGAEFAVLEGVDHSKFRFDWILIESRNDTSVKEKLTGLGYSYVAKLSENDLLFRDARLQERAL